MILDHEKQRKNHNLVLYLHTWAVSKHKNVEVRPKHSLSISCYQAKVGADELLWTEYIFQFACRDISVFEDTEDDANGTGLGLGLQQTNKAGKQTG